MRLGFICLTEEYYSESSLNESIARAMLNLIDKLVLVVPSESMTRKISDSIESMPDRSILQLRKYIHSINFFNAGVKRLRNELSYRLEKKYTYILKKLCKM